MASNYSLESSIIALSTRLDELKSDIENHTPELGDVAIELSAIAERAAALSGAASGIDKILSEL